MKSYDIKWDSNPLMKLLEPKSKIGNRMKVLDKLHDFYLSNHYSEFTTITPLSVSLGKTLITNLRMNLGQLTPLNNLAYDFRFKFTLLSNLHTLSCSVNLSITHRLKWNLFPHP